LTALIVILHNKVQQSHKRPVCRIQGNVLSHVQHRLSGDASHVTEMYCAASYKLWCHLRNYLKQTHHSYR